MLELIWLLEIIFFFFYNVLLDHCCYKMFMG